MTIFATIHNEYQEQLKSINNILIDRARGKSQLANNIIENLVSFKGKRIRPLLVVIANRIISNNNKQDNYLKIAAAIELLHNATLLHDDVIDDSKMRRGRVTANYQWGNKAGILSGDLLLATSFQIIIEVGQMDILQSIAAASKIMSDGEISQLSNIGNININQDQYLDIIYAKTAILFSVATKAGAILSGANIDEIKSLENFGMNLGMSFQIMDDILDYDSTNDKLGKNIADDFMEGKVTLPIILLNQICSNVEKEVLNNVFKKNNDITYDDFNKVKIMIEKYGIISKSKNLAYKYIKNAKDNLENFQNSKDKESALSISEYIVKQG